MSGWGGFPCHKYISQPQKHSSVVSQDWPRYYQRVGMMHERSPGVYTALMHLSEILFVFKSKFPIIIIFTARPALVSYSPPPLASYSPLLH